MSGIGAPSPTAGDGSGLRLAIVASRWHAAVMDNLIAGARQACADHNTLPAELIRVPGSFELPLGAAVAIDRGFDAVVALGVVIRGQTPHFEYVCRAATDQLARLSVDARTPIGFGLLTCDTDEQARARSRMPDGARTDPGANKGVEAASAAVELALLLRPERVGLSPGQTRGSPG